MPLTERIQAFYDQIATEYGTQRRTAIDRAYYQGKLDGLAWVLVELQAMAEDEEES